MYEYYNAPKPIFLLDILLLLWHYTPDLGGDPNDRRDQKVFHMEGPSRDLARSGNGLRIGRRNCGRPCSELAVRPDCRPSGGMEHLRHHCLANFSQVSQTPAERPGSPRRFLFS